MDVASGRRGGHRVILRETYQVDSIGQAALVAGDRANDMVVGLVIDPVMPAVRFAAGSRTEGAVPSVDRPLLSVSTVFGRVPLRTFRADGVPAVSMLMDPATYERYERFGTSLDRRGNRLGPGNRRDLPHLDTAERSIYCALTDPAWKKYRRIEQERIPLTDALAALRALRRRDI